MFYIFHVDTGTTITFDIELALQSSVSELKEAIERECGVSTQHQVLLMSGGESLDSGARVRSYSAGTDTNPIYLFSKAAIENQQPPQPNLDYGSDIDLQTQIDVSLSMPATYATLVSRAHLSQQCCTLARDQVRICERLVHDQHLMQQGWAAVVANLEDITHTFQQRAETLQQSITSYLNERQQHIEVLEHFNLDLRTLEKIPILPALRAHAEGLVDDPEDDKTKAITAKENESSEDSKAEAEESTTTTEVMTPPLTTTSTAEEVDVLSLFRWISAKDNQNSIEQLADNCSRGLEQYDERVMESIKSDLNAAIEGANKQDMKEIKGLGERLYALEQLMAQAKKLVQDQTELAQGFQQNKTRVSNLNDDSVLPDLCMSHRRQLVVMLQNHNMLRDIRRRCTKAKEELSVNIHQRLKWIMYVENKMMEVDNRMVMYHESLRRLRRQLEILRQIHLAPQMYVSAIAEVVRRRTFSQAFLMWASNLACQLLSVHSEEIERRREFQSKFEGHFLNSLFPGLEDTPPPFATEAPPVFDNGLPKLTADDMGFLKQKLPDLASSISTPDLSSITQFFLSKSLTDSSSYGHKEKESTSMPVDSQSKEQEETRPPLISDRGGFESETDTEEFEKIGQAVVDCKLTSFESSKQQQAQNRQKQLEENLSNTREEVERLRTIICNLKAVAAESLLAVRREITNIKERALADREVSAKLIDEITEAVRMHTCALREREQELTVDHELELADLKKTLQNKDEHIESIKRSMLEKELEVSEQERLVITMRQKFEEELQQFKKLKIVYLQMEERIEQLEIEKGNAVREANEATKSEMESLEISLKEKEEKIRELEEKLITMEDEHLMYKKSMKEETEKLQLEYKTQLETIRSRFKLMAASTMERSPSDSSLEKIERVEVIELVNHETILAQTRKDLEAEKEEAIREAIDRERKILSEELRMANELISKQGRELELCRQQSRELSLLEEASLYKTIVPQLDEAQAVIQKLQSDKAELECRVKEEHEKLKERENLLEKDELKRGLEDERLKMSQTNFDLDDALKSMQVSEEKDEIKVSESKKVRLEEDNDLISMRSKVDALEVDNNRLTAELRITQDKKERMESKVESLENERIQLELELVKERSKRNLSAESLSSSSLASNSDGSRDKDMNASVLVVAEIASPTRVDAATSTERTRREASSSSHSIRDKLTKSTTSLVQQGKITYTSCNPGDTVLVLWDQAHRNYTLLQDSQTFYFLNSDCIADLDLRLRADDLPTKLHAVAEVVEKEYCSARKPENRYRVPQGTRFYRVRVKPVQRHVASDTKNE